MYSVLLSKIEAMNLIEEQLCKVVDKESKIAILPWAFPNEINSEKLMNEYFKKGGKRYNKYISQLLKLGIREENIVICDCYGQNKEELAEIINNSDAIVLPGGNPEMMMNKILHQTELIYIIKHYKGTIIGESAGSLLQFDRYFITKENNFYSYTAFYDGIGVIENRFLIDVHSKDTKIYMEELHSIANKTNKKIYAIFDDGAMILNRKSNKCNAYGNVVEIN